VERQRYHRPAPRIVRGPIVGARTPTFSERSMASFWNSADFCRWLSPSDARMSAGAHCAPRRRRRAFRQSPGLWAARAVSSDAGRPPGGRDHAHMLVRLGCAGAAAAARIGERRVNKGVKRGLRN
jgi:hypothetical protein